jgi:hypothetical protein
VKRAAAATGGIPQANSIADLVSPPIVDGYRIDNVPRERTSERVASP